MRNDRLQYRSVTQDSQEGGREIDSGALRGKRGDEECRRNPQMTRRFRLSTGMAEREDLRRRD